MIMLYTYIYQCVHNLTPNLTLFHSEYLISWQGVIDLSKLVKSCSEMNIWSHKWASGLRCMVTYRHSACNTSIDRVYHIAADEINAGVVMLYPMALILCIESCITDDDDIIHRYKIDFIIF